MAKPPELDGQSLGECLLSPTPIWIREIEKEKNENEEKSALDRGRGRAGNIK